jgi:hypothetical protein
MVVKVGDDLYYGADAIHILALMSTKSGMFNRITAWVFQSSKVSSMLYPVLRDGRNFALWMMRVPFIRNLEQIEGR